MTTRMRADRLLVERGLFESRAKAQAAIVAGGVTADGAPIAKPSAEIAVDAALSAAPAHPWVSRGGVKLAAALDNFAIDPADRVCLDVGASTGGFTQVLLMRGARRIYAVDVGRDQLHARLRAEPAIVFGLQHAPERRTYAEHPEPLAGHQLAQDEIGAAVQ